MLLRTRLELSPILLLTPSGVQLALEVRLTRLLPFLLLDSRYLPPRMDLSVYIPCFRCWRDGSCFLSMALDDEHSHILMRKLSFNTAVTAWACQIAMWDRRNWKWISVTFSSFSAVMPFLRCS